MFTFTPARLRRAFFIVALATAGAVFAGPPTAGTQAPLAQVGKPTAAEAGRILEQFRRSGWLGYVEFELRALPRQGDERVYQGRLWGGFNGQGAVTRIELTDAQGVVQRFLLQNGEQAAVWRVRLGRPEVVQGAALLDPLIPGVEVSAFDLQMPYLYWPEFAVESVVRMRGRPAYTFLFTPPATFARAHSGLQRVRAYFDAQYSAPMQTEFTDAKRVVKTVSLVDLKKVGEQWIPRSFDIRNEVTRDKTRFVVTAVALRLEFAPLVFEPASLTEAVQPPTDRLVRVAP
ncbi:outer membrane lipoprotein-sorting protein [Opitutus sp. ER46]|uniref:outer membrane lipoprotein-sorting protein n=1 Tax=Opitutus sp. ER46 TaxID=2161864 RepID=UPI0013050562|nr:outer membrane lipoprotein-sorting protein [Opitutus sp. ER46]